MESFSGKLEKKVVFSSYYEKTITCYDRANENNETILSALLKKFLQ